MLCGCKKQCGQGKRCTVAPRRLVLSPSGPHSTIWPSPSHKSPTSGVRNLTLTSLPFTHSALSQFMSPNEPATQSGYPDDFSDAMANMTASVLQEQLAPILETLREHARLLDLHAALLNHSTAMNRYNVGKLDDIRDFQNNIK